LEGERQKRGGGGRQGDRWSKGVGEREAERG